MNPPVVWQHQSLPRPAPRRVLAFGAWLKNTACRLEGDQLTWSPLHGDLAQPAQCEALEASAEALAGLGEVDVIVHDLHPDFFSTRLALAWAERLGVPAIGVQHHHAHIAALQAEHGIVGPLLGLALDGVGLGTDGTAWGGEGLWVDGASWQRLGHLTPLRLPGGDVAAREPWRMTAAACHLLGRPLATASLPGLALDAAMLGTLERMLDKGLNSPVTTSAGRWFDAAAGALGLGRRQAFEAEAAIALEKAAAAWLADHTLVADERLVPIGADGVIDMRPLMACLLDMAPAPAGEVDAQTLGRGAAIFHVALADGLARWAVQTAHARRIDTVALGGGCFLNRLLVQRLCDGLQRHARAQGLPPLRVLQAQAVSCGDAGLALGQAWVGAHADVQAATHGVQPCA